MHFLSRGWARDYYRHHDPFPASLQQDTISDDSQTELEEEAQEDDEEFENSSSANRQWIGGTILQAGKAAVIGSGSNDGTAVFLILRANIVK